MRKLVNGKIVDINNLELFEYALECKANKRQAINSIKLCKLGVDIDIIQTYIEVYERFYKSLPYPMYLIDNSAKYCCAGLFIQKEVDINNTIWVDNGLWIDLGIENRNIAIQFINDSWAILETNDKKESNLNLNEYKDCIGFTEFIWILSKLLRHETTSQFYNEFMPDFINACENQLETIKHELSNIFNFYSIPDKINLPMNKIVDIDNSREILLDIFLAGYRKSEDKIQVWGLDGSSHIEQKNTEVYDFNTYEKHIGKNGIDKLKITNIKGISALFYSLCSIKTACNIDAFSNFKGIMADNKIIYNINNRIFITRANTYEDPEEIAREADIYGYKPGIIYIVKYGQLLNGVRKEHIYSYGIKSKELRLCSINFTESKH